MQITLRHLVNKVVKHKFDRLFDYLTINTDHSVKKCSNMKDIVCIQDFEDHAFQILPKYALDYYKSGASSQQTLKLNRKAFSNLRIRPKVMRNITNRNISTKIMGEMVTMPIGIAPTAMHKMACPEGECATAKAAQDKGVVYIASTAATTTIEEIAAAAPQAIKWMQLYVYKDRNITKQIARRAEKAGFKALVITVDAQEFGLRLADVRNKFALPPHLKLVNFEQKFLDEASAETYVSSTFHGSLTWDDLKWLKKLTKLPILLKGILTGEDALTAAKMGVAGIIVSNHGGRQLDSVPATIEVLPEIIKAVGNTIDVYVDGGFREGVDVFKALALGAKMVFVGRPIIWGLSHSGQNGVKTVLDILRNELDNALALAGCTSVQDISKDMVVHKSYYSRL